MRDTCRLAASLDPGSVTTTSRASRVIWTSILAFTSASRTLQYTSTSSSTTKVTINQTKLRVRDENDTSLREVVKLRSSSSVALRHLPPEICYWLIRHTYYVHLLRIQLQCVGTFSCNKLLAHSATCIGTFSYMYWRIQLHVLAHSATCIGTFSYTRCAFNCVFSTIET